MLQRSEEEFDKNVQLTIQASEGAVNETIISRETSLTVAKLFGEIPCVNLGLLQCPCVGRLPAKPVHVL